MGNLFLVSERLNLEHTFENGQCFRWRQVAPGHYAGVAHEKILEVQTTGEGTFLSPMDETSFSAVFQEYFGFGEMYQPRQKKLSKKDLHLRCAYEYCGGFSILRQDPWETLISFILSQNNHLQRIRSLVEKLAVLRGKPLVYEGNTAKLMNISWHGFPSARELQGVSEEELRKTGLGYRAKYVIDAVEKTLSGEVGLGKINALSHIDAKRELKKIKGVGDKVADCVLLFAYGFPEAFPIDVWVARALDGFYSDEIKKAGSREAFIREYFEEEAGLAQQMLFHSLRNGRCQ